MNQSNSEAGVQEMTQEQAINRLIINYVEPLKAMFGERWFTVGEAMKKTQGQVTEEALSEVLRAMIFSNLAVVKKGGKAYKHNLVFKVTPTFQMALLEVDKRIEELEKELTTRKAEKQAILDKMKDLEKVIGESEEKSVEN